MFFLVSPAVFPTSYRLIRDSYRGAAPRAAWVVLANAHTFSTFYSIVSSRPAELINTFISLDYDDYPKFATPQDKYEVHQTHAIGITEYHAHPKGVRDPLVFGYFCRVTKVTLHEMVRLKATAGRHHKTSAQIHPQRLR